MRVAVIIIVKIIGISSTIVGCDRILTRAIPIKMIRVIRISIQVGAPG